MNIELVNHNLKRNPTILFIIFSIITIGIYQIFWVFSRTDSLNNISKSKLNDALPFLYLLGYIFLIGIGFYEGFTGNSVSIFSSISPLIQLLVLVLMWVIAFKMKNLLKEFSDNNEIYIRYNGFLTFLLTFTYINYKINENIDYIAEHSIVDKGETPTNEKTPNSVTEATSDKTPGRPEEKLQKLANMKEKGLINEEDYNNKKEEILKNM